MKFLRVTCFEMCSYVNYSTLYFTSIWLLHNHMKCDAEVHGGVRSLTVLFEKQ